MARRKSTVITNVQFTYEGTGQQFTEFLKMLVHDYLAADTPYTKNTP